MYMLYIFLSILLKSIIFNKTKICYKKYMIYKKLIKS